MLTNRRLITAWLKRSHSYLNRPSSHERSSPERIDRLISRFSKLWRSRWGWYLGNELATAELHADARLIFESIGELTPVTRGIVIHVRGIQSAEGSPSWFENGRMCSLKTLTKPSEMLFSLIWSSVRPFIHIAAHTISLHLIDWQTSQNYQESRSSPDFIRNLKRPSRKFHWKHQCVNATSPIVHVAGAMSASSIPDGHYN